MINEKLGVPEGINLEAERIYKGVISNLDEIFIPEYKPKKIFIDNFKVEIKDIKVNIEFIVNLTVHNNIELNEPKIISYNFNHKTRITDKLNIKSIIKDPSFSLEIAITDETTKEDIKNLIKDELEVDSIAHELMHLYDIAKSGEKSIEDYSVYSAITMGGFPKKISSFLYLLYYMNVFENAVRPTEMYQMLLNNNVTKDEFLHFVENTDMMKKFRKAENFSIEKFKEELNNDKEVKLFVEKIINESDDYERLESLADDVLNIVLINLSNKIIEDIRFYIQKYVDSHSIKMLLYGKDVFELANKTFKNIVNRYKKYNKNPSKYFEYIEKNLNFTGNKMKRKIYKLFDMIKDTENKNSIVNWELHNKIYSKNEIKRTLDFESFKIKKPKK